jgi:hypothetical protein
MIGDSSVEPILSYAVSDHHCRSNYASGAVEEDNGAVFLTRGNAYEGDVLVRMICVRMIVNPSLDENDCWLLRFSFNEYGDVSGLRGLVREEQADGSGK